uniref:Cytochrome P450 n=1 Tax=Fagus sylvatica TaxID=28930 RepID=A0A2N9GVR5_FAGSY
MSKAKRQNHMLLPGPWKMPLIGNLHQLVFSLPHRSLTDLAKKYGPIMQLQLGEVLAIVISSPKVAKEVMKTHDAAFANQPNVLAVEVMSYDNLSLIFSRYNDYWRKMRKILVTEFLSAKRIQSFKTIREEEVWNLIESISSSYQGLQINFTEKMSSLTYGITARAAIGKKCKYEKELISLIKETFILSGGFDVPDLFPSLKFLSFLTGTKPALEKMHRKLDRILDDIIKDHKKKRSSTSASKHEGSDPEDIVDVLLKLQEAGELDFNVTSNHIKAVTLDVFSGASETSATMMEWTMSELLRNPRVMEKAQAEVRRVLKGQKNIDDVDIQKLDYLKLVVKEILRLHPPAALIPRESREKCEINGYEIPNNTKVFINAWAIGRDTEYWIDADSFCPERFQGSLIDFKGTNFEFILFGGGRRICPGISFALANIELFLSQLLYHFNWKLPNEIKPEELDMSESFGLSCRRKNDLHLIVTPWTP